MAELDPIVTGDVDITRTVTLGGVDDLSNVSSIEAHIWRTGDDVANLTATVADATARTVEIDFGGSSGWLATLTSPTLGHEERWNLEVEVTFNDNSVITWPVVYVTVRGGG